MTIAPIPATVAVSRIMGFDLATQHGCVTGMRLLPYAWRPSIRNDGNFDTATSGFAIVGAAVLDPPGIVNPFSLTPKPDHLRRPGAAARRAPAPQALPG